MIAIIWRHEGAGSRELGTDRALCSAVILRTQTLGAGSLDQGGAELWSSIEGSGQHPFRQEDQEVKIEKL